MKILVRNLDRKTTAAQIRALFEPFGKIDSCDLVMDKATGQSKGFGFVEMPSPEAAAKAVHALNGKHVGKSNIRVKPSET